mgnify:FL=1
MSERTWAEDVAAEQASGAPIFAPNGLPITVLRHDGTTLEHEHADHPDYKFPVAVEYIGSPDRHMWHTAKGIAPMTADEAYADAHETHALIYTDGYVAVTMHEHCYAMWYLHDGELARGSLWIKGEWRLTREAVERIRVSVKP